LPTVRPDSSVTIDPAALRRLRLEAGLSQVGLAELAGGDPRPEALATSPGGGERRTPRLHAVTICNYERGAYRRISDRSAHRLANGLSRALGRAVDISEFTIDPEQAASPTQPAGIAS
jgi:transcriptional regulator with XRE-family HTH domain